MYLGGFSVVGGIESFAREFLIAIASNFQERELIIWGKGPKDNSLLRDIANSGVLVRRSAWRWGCRWNLPDFVLFACWSGRLRNAAITIFKKPPPIAILRQLRKLNPHSKFVLITPYRPAEYWSTESKAFETPIFDVIVVQSEQGQRDLVNLGFKGRVEVIPYIPPARIVTLPFPNHKNPGVIRLGFVGRLEKQKNLHYLIECYKELQLKNSPDLVFELHIYGAGSEQASLEQSSADLMNVHFHGSIATDEVLTTIDMCDMILIASTTEGQCLVALEALSRGRPIVSTPVGALPEVLFDEALGEIAPLRNSVEFSNSIQRIANKIKTGVSDPTQIERTFSERYGKENIVNRYIALLESLE